MKHLRKITLFALFVLVVSSFTGCGAILGDDEYYSVNMDSEERGREKAEELISYINKKDAAGIKSMFSEKNIKENKDLDSKINELISAFPDGLTEYESSPFVGGHGSTESWSVNFNIETVNIYIPEIAPNTGDEDMLISIEYTHINHYHEDQVGVNLIRYCDRTGENEKELLIGCEWEEY